MPSAIAERLGGSEAAAPASPRMPPPPAFEKFVRPRNSSSARSHVTPSAAVSCSLS
jgi:hypothetical protein